MKKEPGAKRYANWHIFSCSFRSENKLGFSIIFHSFVCLVWSFFFFSFVHSITLKKEEKEFLFSSFVLTHSVSLDSSDERNIAHTHTWRRERGGGERESALAVGRQTHARARSKNSDTVQEFSQNDWIIITKKLAITTPRNKEMFKPHCLTGIFPAFFFFFL